MRETMPCGVKVDIKVQSFGDVITNSSSEVFCTIASNRLEEIVAILEPLFPNKDVEMGPVMHIYDTDEGDSCISINVPYDMYGYEEFYRKGLTAILDQYLGAENYTITYEN